MWKASSLTPRDAQAMEPQCGPSQAQSDFLAPVVLDLSLGSPKSRPERRISVLLVYLGGEHKKQSEREWGKEGNLRKGTSVSRFLLWAPELSHTDDFLTDCLEYGSKLSHWKVRKLGISPPIPGPCCLRAVLEGANILALLAYPDLLWAHCYSQRVPLGREREKSASVWTPRVSWGDTYEGLKTSVTFSLILKGVEESVDINMEGGGKAKMEGVVLSLDLVNNFRLSFSFEWYLPSPCFRPGTKLGIIFCNIFDPHDNLVKAAIWQMRKRIREVKKLPEGHTGLVLPVLVSPALHYFPKKCNLTSSEDGSELGGLGSCAVWQI